MSSFIRRGCAAAGTVLAAGGATFALMLGSAGAAHADPPCSGSSYCVKPPPEFGYEASECIPPAVIGGAAGAPGGPGGVAAGAAGGGLTCGYNKAIE